MSTGDRRIETTGQLYMRAVEQRDVARQQIGAMLYCLKWAYEEQLSPRTALAQSLLETIHAHEPGWKPEPKLAGSFQSNGTKAAPKPWVAGK